MAFTSAVANLIPGTMALSTLGRSVKMIPGEYWKNGKKKTNGKSMIKGFVPIMAGIPMISATANLTSGL